MAPAKTSPYTYQPLPKPRTIRLLRLGPSPSHAKPLQCRLQQVSLDDLREKKKKHSYEALSYTWGAKNGSVPILCEGRRLLVTPNCESALRHLRHKLTPRLLWIDAICINQKSTDEKNYQVQLMGEIYARAERVIIWLGPGVPDDEELFRKARRRGRVSHSRGQSDTSSASFIDSWIEEPKSETLDRISNNAWFTRVWTIQEMLLALNPVFRIGHSECPTSSMYTYFLVKAGSEILGNSRFQMRVRALEILQPEAAKSKALLSKVIQYGRTPETDSTELLSMILKLASLSEASDSRDKFYGILGLLQIFTKATFPPVDYTRDDTQIFEESARCMIRMTGCLWPLEVICRPFGNTSNMASWVPDLRDPASIDIEWQPGVYRAVSTDKEMPFPRTTQIQKKLSARLPPGPVRAAEMTSSDFETPGRLPVEAKFLVKVAEVYDRMPMVETGTEDDDLMRTLCFSSWTSVATGLDLTQPVGQKPSADYIEALHYLTPGLSSLHQNPACDEESRPSYHNKAQYDGAALFRTSCGLLGLCKGDIRPQDKVLQLAGGRYPFVLHHEYAHGRSWWYAFWLWLWCWLWDRGNDYRLIGIADVHGLKEKTAWSEDYVEGDFHKITII